MTKGFWAVVALTGVGLVVAFILGTIIQRESTPNPDTQEFSLLVCLNGAGTPIYQGLVEDVHISRSFAKFHETTGLTRFISGATCVLTEGTAAEFTAADALAKQGGSLGSDTNTDEDHPVPSPQP